MESLKNKTYINFRFCLLLIFIFLLPLLIVSCTTINKNSYKNSETLVFKGESDNWIASITEDYTEIWKKGKHGRYVYDYNVTLYLSIEFKRCKEKPEKSVSIHLDAPGLGLGKPIYLDEKGRYSEKIYEGHYGSHIIRRNEILLLELKWDSGKKEEVIELKTTDHNPS